MKIKENMTLRADGKNLIFDIDKPNVCPLCKQSGDHSVIGKNINRESEIVSITLECTMCYEIFFAKYIVITEKERFSYTSTPIVTHMTSVHPLEKIESNLPDEMNSLYPEFEEIYNQAMMAQSQGLHLITGIAFRKSLEFLVKLYLIESSPNEEESIKKETLGKSITRINYPVIQKLAKAATWLGNDEAHFVRKHIDYDVSDMKKFILSLSHLIVAEKVADEASELVD